MMRKSILMPVYNEIDYDGRVQRAAEALAEQYDVTVLSIDSGKGYVNERFSVLPVPLGLGGWKPGRHLRFWQRLWRTAVWRKPAVIHAHDFFMAWPGWAAARSIGARFVYDAHELIIPERDRPLARREQLFYRLERWAVRRADQVIAANSRRAELMQKHYRLPRTPVAIQNIPPAPRKAPDAEATLQRWPQLRRSRLDTVRVVYQGDIDLDRGLLRFVEAMKLLDDHFEIVFLGGGPHVAALAQHCRDAGLGARALVPGRMPRADLEAFLPTCNIGIVTYNPRGLNNIYCAPNKVYEYAQAAVPLLAVGSQYLCDLVGRHGIGIGMLQDRAPPEAVAGALLAISRSASEYRQRCVRFAQECSWEHERARLLELYHRLFSCTRPTP